MKKRGQITIFLVFGLLIGISFLVISLYFGPYVDKPDETNLGFSSVKNYVDSCLSKVQEDALLSVGSQGGYYSNPIFFTLYNFNIIPYYFYEGRDISPSKSFLEKEIGSFIEDNLPLCLDGFLVFKEFNVQVGKLEVSSKILSNKVTSKITLPLQISKGKSLTNLDSFMVQTKSNLLELFNIAKSLSKEQEQFPSYLLVSNLIDISNEKFSFRLISNSKGDLIYALVDNDQKIREKPYIFFFAMEREEGTFNQEKELVIFPIEDQLAIVGQEFRYNIRTEKDNLKFSALTDLFTVNQEGTIIFIPNEDQVGQHQIVITVEDGLGNEDFELMSLEVLP